MWLIDWLAVCSLAYHEGPLQLQKVIPHQCKNEVDGGMAVKLHEVHIIEIDNSDGFLGHAPFSRHLCFNRTSQKDRWKLWQFIISLHGTCDFQISFVGPQVTIRVPDVVSLLDFGNFVHAYICRSR